MLRISLKFALSYTTFFITNDCQYLAKEYPLIFLQVSGWTLGRMPRILGTILKITFKAVFRGRVFTLTLTSTVTNSFYSWLLMFRNEIEYEHIMENLLWIFISECLHQFSPISLKTSFFISHYVYKWSKDFPYDVLLNPSKARFWLWPFLWQSMNSVPYILVSPEIFPVRKTGLVSLDGP